MPAVSFVVNNLATWRLGSAMCWSVGPFVVQTSQKWNLVAVTLDVAANLQLRKIFKKLYTVWL